MRRLVLLLPVFLLLVSVAHAETYTRMVSSSDMGKYSLEQTWQQGSCYELGVAAYSSLGDCQAALQNVNQSNTTIDSCGQVTKQTYTYTFPGPACSDVLSSYNMKLADNSSGNSTPSPSAANSGAGSAGTSGSSGGVLENPLNNINSLPDLLDTILKALVELGSILLVVMLVYVGFLFVSAQGNAEKLSTARSALMWTVIGGLILLGAEAISQVIQATVKSL